MRRRNSRFCARSGWVAIDFKELLHYRELLYFLTWRDVKVRYKQTVLGFAWAIIQPVMTVIIQTVIFGTVAGFASRLPQELKDRQIPYALFNYAGVLAWTLFATGVSSGGTSLMNQQNLLTKIYFPRLFVPTLRGRGGHGGYVHFLGDVLHVDGVLRGGTVVDGRLHSAAGSVTALVAMGMAYVISSLTVTYRDFRFLLPFMVSTWRLCSPVGYPLDPHRQWIRWLLRLNPMYGIINAYRSALLEQHWDSPGWRFALVEVAAILLFGLYYFKKTERRFADIA